MTSTWIGRQRVAILATLFFSCKGVRYVNSLRVCTDAHVLIHGTRTKHVKMEVH